MSHFANKCNDFHSYPNIKNLNCPELWIPFVFSQFCRIKGCGGAGWPPPPIILERPTNYISSEREFIGESESLKILEKYFDFAIL